MKKTGLWIKTDSLQGRADVLSEDTVYEGEHGIDSIARWTAVTPVKWKSLLSSGQDQCRKNVEVTGGSFSLNAAHMIQCGGGSELP